MAGIEHPCARGLSRACFAEHPGWAKQAFAVRLMNSLVPANITRRLPKIPWSTRFLFPPGWMPGDPMPFGMVGDSAYFFPAGWTPGDPLPLGITANTGAIFPPGWTPGDPVPEGIIMAPGATFPPGWMPGDPLPSGVSIDTAHFFPASWRPGDPMPFGITIDTGQWFPPGWTPGDDLPEGLEPAPVVPPEAEKNGIIPPPHLGPGAPLFRPPGGKIPGKEYTVGILGEATDGTVYSYDTDWGTAWGGTGSLGKNDTAGYRYDMASVRLVGSTYELTRGFFEFNLGAIPAAADCVAATVKILSYGYYDSSVDIFQGIWTPPLATSDWAKFDGDSLANVVWSSNVSPTGDWNEFALNASGRAFVASKFGQKIQFVCREHIRDVGKSGPPTPADSKRNGCWFANYADADYHPRIDITYEV